VGIETLNIDELPAAATLSGSDLIELQQGAQGVRSNLADIINFIVTTDAFNNAVALRIPAFLEDYFDFGTDDLTILTNVNIAGDLFVNGDQISKSGTWHWFTDAERTQGAWDINVNPNYTTWTLCDLSGHAAIPAGASIKAVFGKIQVAGTDATSSLRCRPYGSVQDDGYGNAFQYIAWTSSTMRFEAILTDTLARFEIKETSSSNEMSAFQFEMWGFIYA
jgi:hypothetical protein